MRLRRIKEEMGEALSIQCKAFPLRPEPDPGATFKGTHREEGWRRCGAMAMSDGIRFNPWPREDYPNWSLPALEAAKCVARQGPEAFDRLHLRLYEAVFTRGINIAVADELTLVVRESGADMTRFLTDFESGTARDEVRADYEAALTRDRVRAIPTIIVESGRRLTGLVDLPTYRKVIEEAAGGVGECPSIARCAVGRPATGRFERRLRRRNLPDCSPRPRVAAPAGAPSGD